MFPWRILASKGPFKQNAFFALKNVRKYLEKPFLIVKFIFGRCKMSLNEPLRAFTCFWGKAFNFNEIHAVASSAYDIFLEMQPWQILTYSLNRKLKTFVMTGCVKRLMFT